MKAVILLSGGLDSATVLAIARAEKRACIALSFAYGQRHEIELKAAKRVAQAAGGRGHVAYTLDLRQFGASALTGDIAVPKDEVGKPGIPVTYGYVSDAHDGHGVSGNQHFAYGPGEAGYVQQLHDYDTAFQQFFDRLAALLGRHVVVERSGGSLPVTGLLRRHFPDARFVHMCRDGPDCALSMSRFPPSRIMYISASGSGQWPA